MKKICMLVLMFVFILNFSACNSETVTLHCDGEDCENTVDVEVEGDNVPDESWVVFCQNCADDVLDD